MAGVASSAQQQLKEQAAALRLRGAAAEISSGARAAARGAAGAAAKGLDGRPLYGDFDGDPFQRHVSPLLYIEQVMTKPAMVLHENLQLGQALALFLEKHITGAPVVDDGGRVVGVLSLSDIMWVEVAEQGLPFYPTKSTDSMEFYEELEASSNAGSKILQLLVRDQMSAPVVTCSPMDVVSQAAKVRACSGRGELTLTGGLTLAVQPFWDLTLQILQKLADRR